jgi:hypothetical protein
MSSVPGDDGNDGGRDKKDDEGKQNNGGMCV